MAYAAFIDVGFLKAEGARQLGQPVSQVKPDAAEVVAWLRGLQESGLGDTELLRAYWYDGAFDQAHPQYHSQRRFFDAIAYTPGIQLRLGHIAERRSRLETPVVRALESTAHGLGVDPEALVSEFQRHWTFYPERQQKGVDTLLALDLVRLADRHAYDTAIVIAGDRDLAEAVRTAQDAGRRVVVATPSRQSLAGELCQLADAVIDLDVTALHRLLKSRAGGQ